MNFLCELLKENRRKKFENGQRRPDGTFCDTALDAVEAEEDKGDFGEKR